MSSLRALLPSLALLSLLTVAAPARAHDGPVEVTSLHARGATERMLGTTFGIVHRPEGSDTWEVVCSEATGWSDNVRGAFHLGSHGTMYVGSPHGLSVSRDNGCSWTEVPELKATGVSEIRGHPTDPQRLFALTGKFNQDNGVFRSDDGGATFPTPVLSERELYFSGLRFAPSQPDRAWISAWYFSPQRAVLYRSDDGGDSFTELTVTGVVPFSGFTLLAVHPEDPDVLFAQAFENFEYHLLRSTNGGQSFGFVASDARVFRSVHFSADAQTVWAAAERLHRSDDGGETFARVDSPLRAGCVGGFGPETGGTTSADEAFACGFMLQDGWALAKVDAMGGVEPTLRFEEIEERQCPAGTPGRDVCRPLWPALAIALGKAEAMPDGGTPGDGDGGVEGPDAGVKPGSDGGDDTEWDGTGCDCSSAGAAVMWSAPLLIALALRRRGRRA